MSEKVHNMWGKAMKHEYLHAYIPHILLKCEICNKNVIFRTFLELICEDK